MLALRVSAIATLSLLGIYFVVRFAAAQCSGARCDAYIWPSLALPTAVGLMVGNTGRLAVSHARKGAREWVVPLITTTVLGVLGPIVGAIVFRDKPDAVVALAAVLFLLTPLATLVYSFRESRPPLP